MHKYLGSPSQGVHLGNNNRHYSCLWIATMHLTCVSSLKFTQQQKRESNFLFICHGHRNCSRLNSEEEIPAPPPVRIHSTHTGKQNKTDSFNDGRYPSLAKVQRRASHKQILLTCIQLSLKPLSGAGLRLDFQQLKWMQEL